MRHPHLAAPLTLLMAVMLFTAAAARAEAPPPETWFQQRLDDDAYAAAADRLRPDVEAHVQQADAAGDRPTRGVVLWDVGDDTPADAVGMKVGDLITRVDDQPVTSMASLKKLLDPGLGQPVVWFDAAGKEHEHFFGPGLLGIKYTDHQNRFAWYMRRADRDGPWHRDLSLALHLLPGEPRDPALLDLAETALARTVAAGYPADALICSLAAEFALYRNRPADAAALLALVPDEPVGHPEGSVPYVFWRTASASYQPRKVAALLGRHSRITDLFNSPETDFWLADLDVMFDPDAPTPADAAADAKRTALNPQLTFDPGRFADASKWLGNRIVNGQPVDYEVAPARYRVALLAFPQDVNDFELRVKLGAEGMAPENDDYPNHLTIKLLDGDRMLEDDAFWRGPINLLALMVRFTPDQIPRLQLGYGPFPTGVEAPAPAFLGGPNAGHVLRFLRVGPRGQLLLNGQPLLDVPVDPDVTNLRLFIHTVGLHVHFDEVTLEALKVQ